MMRYEPPKDDEVGAGKGVGAPVARHELRHRGVVALAVVLALVVFALVRGWGPTLAGQGPTPPGTALLTVVDPNGPRAAWGKSVGDVNGDGLLDLVVGGHEPHEPSLVARILGKLGIGDPWSATGELVWYENPSWAKHFVSDEYAVRTDLEVADIDQDGRNDIVVLADEGVFWLRNPDWEPAPIDDRRFHDIEVSDLDRDGDIDLVLRNQSSFGANDGDRVHILVQGRARSWTVRTVDVSHGEGLLVVDLDGDSYDDIIVNDVWLRNPEGRVESDPWQSVDYTEEWDWADVFIAAADINGDGNPDIVASPAEPPGQYYRISWFEAPDSGAGPWTEHIVDEHVEAVHHFIGAGDIDGDSDQDLLSAKMNQGAGPAEVKVYLNDGTQTRWEKSVFDTAGSHSMQVADLDSDLDVEVFGANWFIEDYDGAYAVRLWDFSRDEEDQWRTHVIADRSPWRNLFVEVGDLDGDGFQDIVAGNSWYRNPQDLSRAWRRFPIGEGANSAVLLHDFDHDGLTDILASRYDGMIAEPGFWLRARRKLSGAGYPGSQPGDQFVWARNLGGGSFRVYDNIEQASGDFLQGVAVISEGPRSKVLFSWHGAGNGLQAVSVPDDPANQTWQWERLSAFSQDESVSVADMDGDGDVDIVTGTAWLDASGLEPPHRITASDDPPDRHWVLDLNRDGRSDVLVGYEAVSELGKVAWYEQAVDQGPEAPWTEHVIGEFVGPMSLGVADMDDDGDLDVIIGEHDLDRPAAARLLYLENVDGLGATWNVHLVARGQEHHVGAVVADLDNDGDRDVVSIGWGHSQVLVYENLRLGAVGPLSGQGRASRFGDD